MLLLRRTEVSDRFDISIPQGSEYVLSELELNGAVLIEEMFPESVASWLADEANRLKYDEWPKVYGARKVRQEVASVELPKAGLLDQFAEEMQQVLVGFFPPSVFSSPLKFNYRNIQRYLNNTIGIEPHRDEPRYRNLVVLCGLSGEGSFNLFHELDDSPYLTLRIVPGSALLMSAPGYKSIGEGKGPLHSVTEIRGNPNRYVLAMRHDLAVPS
jgi:hypothetical protein